MQRDTEGDWKTDIAAPFRNGIAVVDIAIFDFTTDQILLGRREGSEVWRFPGGFVDHTDESYEFAAKREKGEEAPNIEASLIQYVMSVKVDDPRYREDKNRAFTALYLFEYLWGNTKAGDDLAELRWFSLDSFLQETREYEFAPEHEVFVRKLGEVIDIVKARKP